MKKALFLCVAFVTLLSVFSPATTFGQYSNDAIGQEKRPFDFKFKYYRMNGVDPNMMIERRSGFDKYSVIDFINSDIHRNVRVIGTSPAYDYNGGVMYFATLGYMSRDGFMDNPSGSEASETARRFPVFTFPSTTVKQGDRQADIVETRGSYFEKNVVGISAVIDVEYTEKAYSKEGQARLREILGRNGMDLDGTFIIKRIFEIDDLTRQGFVTQRMRGINGNDGIPYMLKQVIRDPVRGAISPDAFLMMVLKSNGKPLDGERMFMENFDCLQKSGNWCE